MADKQREPAKAKVLMIGFNPVVREGLHAILATDANIEVTGEVPDGTEALCYIKQSTARRRPINVVLTETRNPKLGWCGGYKAYQGSIPGCTCSGAYREP
jgi:DNA-binding NarL/FixJ family response regulator